MTKICKNCNGKGIIMKMDGISQCYLCKGTGVPLYDEDYDNASTLMGDAYYGDEDDDEGER